MLVKGVLKKVELNLPDLWTDELTTSSMLLIDKIEPLKEPPTQDTIVFKPYTFTGADMVLAKDNEFKKTEELTLYFHVYNPVFENKRPDVTIDYEFLKKDADGEKPAADGGRQEAGLQPAEVQRADPAADVGPRPGLPGGARASRFR